MNDLAVVADAGYLPWCAVTLRSAARSWRGEVPLRTHLLHDGTVDGAATARLATVVEELGGTFTSHRADPGERFPVPEGYPAIVWLRFLLPEILGDVERVLYLDVDTYVADSLHELDAADLAGRPIGAVRNVVTAEQPDRGVELGLGPGAYFNSGVLAIELGEWRRAGYDAALLDHAAREGAGHRYPDQDALNVVFAGAWAELDPRWNCQGAAVRDAAAAAATFGVDAARRSIERPAVLHFEGPAHCKPWHVSSRHPWTDAYRACLAETPWAGTGLVSGSRIGALAAKLPAPARDVAVRSADRLRRRRTHAS